MPMAERRAAVSWDGNLTEGKGVITSTGSGALHDLPVTWASRVEKSDGRTSPEELIAAAHASCYSMALSHTLNGRGTPPTHLDVTAVCALERIEGGIKIATMDLTVRGRVPGVDQAAFESAAKEAGQGCPVSAALRGNVEIRVHATLES